MLKIASAIKAHCYLALILVVALFGVLSGVVFGLSRRSKRTQAPAPTIAVNNRTNAVRVLSYDRTNVAGVPYLEVSFQNVSDKDIKAVTITAGQMSVTDDLFLAEEAITRGAITTRRIALSDDDQTGLNGSSERGFTVAAVAFADGTGNGDPKLVKVLSDEYAGIRDQAKRIAGKLRALSSVVDESAMADLETQVNALPTTGDRLASRSYEEGLSNAREMLLLRLREIKERRKSNTEAAQRKQERVKMLFESFVVASDLPK